MRKLAIYLLTVAACHGQWDTNAWPSWTAPRAGETQIWQTYSALVERCRLAGVAMPSEPAWYRFARSELIAHKEAMDDLLSTGDWLAVPTNAAVSNAVHTHLSGVVTSRTDTAAYPTWAASDIAGRSNILTAVGLPANYLDYTPWRALNGLGGKTNDASVGHAHGFTNATTAAGGTNFPSGRDTWYTTDYGRNGLYVMCNHLRAIKETPVFSKHPTNDYNARFASVDYASLSGDKWTVGEGRISNMWNKTGSYTNYSNPQSFTGDALYVDYYKVQPYYGSGIGLRARRQFGEVLHENTNTITRRVMAWAWVPTQDDWETSYSTNSVLDFHGDGLSSGLSKLGQTSTSTNQYVSFIIGNTGYQDANSESYLPTPPANPEAPSYGGDPKSQVRRGYQLGGGYPTYKVIEAEFQFR